LKNLAKQAPVQPQEQTPPARPQPQRQQLASAASSQPIAPLGAQLSTSEMDMVRQQIAGCWNIPAGGRDAKDMRVVLRISADPDGTVRSATIEDTSRMNDPFYRAAAESAQRALRMEACKVLKLPRDKYDQWKVFTFTFDPKDIL